MMVLGIVLGSLAILLFCILWIRIRVIVTYSEKGLQTILKVWFYKSYLPPEKEKKIEKEGKEESEKSLEEGLEKLPGGKLSALVDFIHLGFQMMGRALHTIQIDEIHAVVNIASENPFTTAMMYGSAAASCGIILPVLENNFKIKKKKIHVNADFQSKEVTTAFRARVSVTIWQVLWLGATFLMKFIRLKRKKESVMMKKKGMNRNGRSCTQ